jgi:single-strand DNA-binding protein
MSVNQITLVGNIGQDPRAGGSESNPIANLTLATTYKYKNNQGETVEDTTWHNVVVFGYSAKFVLNNARKGSKVFVQGRLRTRDWTDKDGAPRKAYEVVADIVELMGANPNSGPSAPRQASAPSANRTPAPQAPSSDMDGDIPF